MRKVLIAILALMPLYGFAFPVPVPKKIQHVIYVTLDGVRWQDIYQTKTYFPIFWQKYAKQMKLYGYPGTETAIETASVPVSLPSYQSQMVGYTPFCMNNHCGKIKVETLPEYLVNRVKLNSREVAVFSSWPKISDAIEHIYGTVYSNTGNMPSFDPETQQIDTLMAALNQQQAKDHPPIDGDGNGRFDRYTFAQALHYLERYRPKFLWISLVDADNAAHVNDLPLYQKTLQLYDGMIDQVFLKLEKLGLKDKTLVIFTTDHGRGNGKNWVSHGPEFPECRQIWAFVWNGELKPVWYDGKLAKYSTLSMRPTMQAIFD